MLPVTPTLHTERLILRPTILADAPAIQQLFADWEIIRQMSVNVPWPYPEGQALLHLEETVLPRLTTGEMWCWTITERERPEALIGMVDQTPNSTKGGHRAFWLGRPYWGKGYVTEAITAIQDWIFTATDLGDFIVMNAKSNPGSRRVKEKTGAELLRMESHEHHSGDTDAEVWIVRRDAWRKLRGLDG